MGTEIATTEQVDIEVDGILSDQQPKRSWPVALTSCKVEAGIVKVESLADVETFARFAIASGYFKEGDATSVAQAGMKMMFGLRMGLDPLEAITDLYMFKGSVGCYARMIARKVKEHPIYDYKIITKTDDVCIIECYTEGKYKDGAKPEDERITFTYKQAEMMGVTGNKPWRFDRSMMLFYKCIARGQKAYWPDLFSGVTVHTKEDFDDAEEMDRLVGKPSRRATVKEAVQIEDAAIAEDMVPTRETLIDGAEKHTAENLMKIAEDREVISSKESVDLNKFAISCGVATPSLVRMIVEKYKFSDPKNWHKVMTKGQLREMREALLELKSQPKTEEAKAT